MKMIIVLAISKFVYHLSRFLKIGSGLTWPGHVILFFYPDFIEKQAKKFTQGVILITGTNGKTTTSQALSFVLRKSGLAVVTNVSGANLLNGIASGLAANLAFFGRRRADIGVFEIDEVSLPLAVKRIKPKFVLLLNLFRDQLDRYGEVETIVTKWAATLKELPLATTLVVNANDPAVSYLGEIFPGKVIYFGLTDSRHGLNVLPHHADSLYCLRCNRSLSYSFLYFSHLGSWFCPNCQRRMPSLSFAASGIEPGKDGMSFKINDEEVKTSLTGLYNVYNFLAVYALSLELGLAPNFVVSALKNFPAHFGRQESLRIIRSRIFGRQIRDLIPTPGVAVDLTVKFLLSKNPTGFNENLRLLKEIGTADDALVFVLNDRIADGTDVSWVYDVDFEDYLPLFERGVYLSGTRFLDLALRFKYAGLSEAKMIVKRKMNEVLGAVFKATPPGSTVYILPTYTAMLEARKVLTGRSF